MKTDTHAHNFGEREWPFEEPINSAAFSTKQVMYEAHPIMLVAHDDSGDWQFLCGTTDDQKDMVVACLGCMYESHPMVRAFASLPRGWLAWRKEVDGEWEVEKQEGEDG